MRLLYFLSLIFPVLLGAFIPQNRHSLSDDEEPVEVLRQLPVVESRELKLETTPPALAKPEFTREMTLTADPRVMIEQTFMLAHKVSSCSECIDQF